MLLRKKLLYVCQLANMGMLSGLLSISGSYNKAIIRVCSLNVMKILNLTFLL